MARMPRGILGPVHGKIGPIVVSDGKNGTNVRAVNKKKADKPSQAQKEQRARFALVSSFLRPLRDLLTQSFANDFLKTKPVDMALSYNVKNTVCGTYPGLYIDYTRVLLSYGHLPPATALSVSSNEPGMLTFNWADNSGQGKANGADKTILIVYNKDHKKSCYRFGGAQRRSGTDQLDIPSFSGEKVVAWLGFISKDGKDIAPGIYAGEVTVM